MTIDSVSAPQGTVNLSLSVALDPDIYRPIGPAKLDVSGTLNITLFWGSDPNTAYYNTMFLNAVWDQSRTIAGTVEIGNPPYEFRNGTFTATRRP